MNMLTVTSPDFEEAGAIPKKHTGFGEDKSPAFNIAGLPVQAKTLAILMEDLDVPFTKAFAHWIIWNLPAADFIPGEIPAGELPSGAVQGTAWGRNVYRGPKQPAFIHKAHRYVFRFYALDAALTLGAEAGKAELLAAIEGHILAEGSITGFYKPE